VSKGARNRAKRAKHAEQLAALEGTRQAVGELLVVQTLDEYVAVLKRRPELRTQEAADQLREASEALGYGPLFSRAAVLLEGACGDAAAAWSTYREATQAAKELADAIRPLEAEIHAAKGAGDHARVLELVDQALPIAMETGFGLSICWLLDERGSALYNIGTIDRANELDGAIDAFSAALQVAVPGEQAAGLLMHLGLAFGERIHGDRADNVEQAVRALRDALSQLEKSDNDDLRAMVLTNLSVALARGEHDDRTAVLQEAADRCREALRVRSPQRNADDWAYSQINLGEALRDLAALGDGDTADARSAFQAVIDRAADIRDRTLVGAAHQMLGGMDLATTRRSADDYIAAHADGTLNDEPDIEPALRAARGHLEAARELITTDPIRRARVLNELSEALAGLGRVDDAVEAARDALSVLRPTTAPDACKHVAWSLGRLLAEREEWRGAAEAMRQAVEAAEFSFHARMDTASREREVRSTGNLHRWAAYAIARAGDAAGAAVVLDAGRGREIGRRMGVDASLGDIPAQLRDGYRTAIQALASSSLGSDSTGASRHLQQVIALIRQLPGHERFGMGPSWEELAQAVEAEWPLVYVNPTPSGTLLLALWPDGATGATAEATFTETTSNEVFMRLIVGDGAELGTPIEDCASYMFSISNNVDPDNVDAPKLAAALDQLLPWLGEAVGRPIAELLAARRAAGATLVVCGPLGLAPLHAVSWKTDGGTRCLAHSFDIRYAPSAVVCAAAKRRATRPRTVRLLALADPQGNLPAARPEVEEIVALFGSANADVAIGPSANAGFLRRHAPRASHVHLACHAHGGLLDATDAAITLASGNLPAVELTTVARLDARLVVASACESAVSQVAGLPDEVVSIATALLASGTACAIASLWPVDDLATALLMTQLYHEMLIGGRRPPEALRRAQLWLRELSDDDEHRFLERHPMLAAEFKRRRHGDRVETGRRATNATAAGRGPDADDDRPYAHPDYWAPFVAVGV
jgi:CHAT domain-containing protein/tetratricopeptide (TPR) repeat protein